MSTSTTLPHTPLETLLLFRGVAQYGLEDAVFARIAEALQNNALIKSGPTYDARRLNPETLRELFLHLVREELRTESEDTPGPDGALSPASKKRRLQSPPLLTLKEARQQVEKIEAAGVKVHDAYMRHAVYEIRQFEQQYEALLKEIGELESRTSREPDGETKPQSPAVPQDIAGRHQAGSVNGVGLSSSASPRPSHSLVSPSLPQHPQRTLQPLLPHPASRQDARTGPQPPSQGVPDRISPAPRSPAPASHPQLVPSPQPRQQDAPRSPVPGSTATPQPPNGGPQVLQAPQGVSPFQPLPNVAPPQAAIEGPRQPPAHPTATAQGGQLKWEPPYQPTGHPPRQVPGVSTPQNPLPALPPPPHPLPAQRSPQQAPLHPGSVPPQGQVSRPPSQQQVLIPPHAGTQFAPPLQSPPVGSPTNAGSGPAPSRQHPLLPNAVASNASQPQSPFHPSPYPSYPVPSPGQPPSLQATHAAPGHTAAIEAGQGRSPVIPPPAGPGAAGPARVAHGLAAPQQRSQPPQLQGLQHGQPPASQVVLSPVPTHPDAAQRYSSPYQPPRPAAVDRIHPRLPATATPVPAARFSPAPSAPHTPAAVFPPKVSQGSGTRWLSTSTPSTPRPGVEFRLGYDDFPSPAYEPTSPVLRHPELPSAASQRGVSETSQKRDVPAEAKQKPSRAHVPTRAQPVGTSSADAEAKPGTLEPRVKDEVTTPRPSTEAGDTTADESVTGRTQQQHQQHPSRSSKRKREDLTPTPVPTPVVSSTSHVTTRGQQHHQQQHQHQQPSDLQVLPSAPPTLVLWTRAFNKVCGSAMEQIVHHRSANMFAQPVRERDAPGYHAIVRQPTDLKTIRAAINHGNRAATAASATLSEGSGTGTPDAISSSSSSVWLPRTEDLVPPKSIINSSQLDRELAHMFSNAIMYNPDPHHGPGPAFLRRDGDEGEGGGEGDGDGGGHVLDSGVLGYKVDEFGVVNDARAMFGEVEKLLSELRSAEVRRNAPLPVGMGTGSGVGGGGTSTRQASAVEGGREEGGGGGKEGDGGGDEGEEHADEGGGMGAGAVKRRRVARG